MPEPIEGSGLEIEILTVKREAIIRNLGDMGYKPAAEAIFDYTRKVRLTTEMTAGFYALGKLGYTPARAFIEEELSRRELWLRRYQNHLRARGVDLVYNQIRVGKQALQKIGNC